MTLKNQGRITSYIMRSDFSTPVTVVTKISTYQAVPSIYKGKIGVRRDSLFYPASVIQQLEV